MDDQQERWRPGRPGPEPETMVVIPSSEWETTQREAKLGRILMELDRCPHGRHQDDPCYGCPEGISAGNPHMRTNEVIGYNRSGGTYVMPGRNEKHDPVSWKQ